MFSYSILGRISSLSWKEKARWDYNNRRISGIRCSLSWCLDWYWVITKRFRSISRFDACDNLRRIFGRNSTRLRWERSGLRDEGHSDSNLLRHCSRNSRCLSSRERRNCSGNCLGGCSASHGTRMMGGCSCTIVLVCRRVIRLRARHSSHSSGWVTQGIRDYDLSRRWLVTIISSHFSIIDFNCAIVGVSKDAPCHAGCGDETLSTLLTRATQSLFRRSIISNQTKVEYILTVPELDTDGRAKHFCDMEHEPRVVSHKVPLHLVMAVSWRHATCPSM